MPPSSPAAGTGFPADALYRKFFNMSEDEMYLHDAQGVLLDVNAAVCNNLGYRREELVGMSVAQISADIDAPQLLELWRNHPVGQNVVTSNCHRRKDGSIYHLDVHITCQEVDGTKLFLAAARRTDEKRQRENEIVQLNRRLRALVDERTRQWQESSRLLNAITEQTPDAIFIKDLQGRYQYVNRALSQQLGLEVQEVLGRTDLEIYPPQQAHEFAASDAEVLRSQQPQVSEARIHDGKKLVFANSMKTPYRDDAGRVAGILGITRNISDIRHAQEQMAHNYAMLCQAERIAKIGSWTLELSSNTFSASEMLAQMNGRGPNDPPLTPQTLAEMIPADQHAVLSAAIGQCIAHGTPYTVDVEHKRPGGGSFPARIQGQAYRDAKGKIIMLHGTLQDLSDHVEADQRLQTLADNLPNGAIFRCLQTAEGKLFLHYVSAGIQRLLGIASNAFLSNQKTFVDQIHSEDKASFFAAVQQSLRSGSAFDLVTRVRHAQGQMRWMRTRAVPRASQQGQLWEGILLDVTAEYEVQASLRQAKEAAEAGERAKSEFLATMSHEIRTPMNTVIGMTQLLQQTAMSARQRNYVDKVALSAHALLRIINDILDFSKLEAQMLHTVTEAFALDDLLHAVTTVTGLQAEQKGIEVLYDIAPEVPRQLYGDMQRLSQVLTNLVGNAIKFTEHGEVLIRMHVQAPRTASAARCCELHVTVRDTGMGIHPDHMAALFQPFTQGEAHITRRFGGTGLGLAICHKLVELMGGAIEVQSTLGAGSTFHFYVLLQAQPETSAPRQLALQHSRVLVVDDNRMAREILCNMVRHFGLECQTASSGAAALHMLEQASASQRPYHLVLMDWQMPEMDGLQAAEQIRRHQHLNATPAVLMVTAHDRDEVVSRVKALQLQGLLIKPVTESMLLNAMQEALSDLLHAQPPTASTLSESADLSRHAPAQLRGRHVLVVDDNAFNREVAQDFLELAGVQVTTADSGRAALQLLAQRSFDAVLLDIQMPEMDGLEVLRRIRQQPALQRLPVWALTAQTRPEDRQAILASGMDGHITKPINALHLYASLAQAISPDTAVPLPVAASTTPDTSAAQQRMHRLHQALLRDFAQAPQQLQALQAQADWPALAQLAHLLKGALGYLPHPVATQAMAQLERASQQGAVPQAQVLAAAQALQQVLHSVAAQLPPASEAPSAAPCPAALDAEALAQLVLQAQAPIRRGDYAGVRLLEQLEQTLRGHALHTHAAQALALAEDLESDAACACLHQLQQALQPHLP